MNTEKEKDKRMGSSKKKNQIKKKNYIIKYEKNTTQKELKSGIKICRFVKEQDSVTFTCFPVAQGGAERVRRAEGWRSWERKREMGVM